jgi:hypothetical protein
VIHEGEFVKGKEEGFGVENWTNGDQYTGWFVNGYNDGLGVWKIGGKLQYIGEWKANEMHGFGVHLNLHDGERSWQGIFHKDKLNDFGIERTNDGKTYLVKYALDKETKRLEL